VIPASQYEPLSSSVASRLPPPFFLRSLFRRATLLKSPFRASPFFQLNQMVARLTQQEKSVSGRFRGCMRLYFATPHTEASKGASTPEIFFGIFFSLPGRFFLNRYSATPLPLSTSLQGPYFLDGTRTNHSPLPLHRWRSIVRYPPRRTLGIY